MLVGVVACAAFAGHAIVQGESVHGEVVGVAAFVLEDDSALDELVDAAADGALVHLKQFTGGFAVEHEAVVLSDKRKDIEQQPEVCALQTWILGKQTCIGLEQRHEGPGSVVPGHIVAADLNFGLYTFLTKPYISHILILFAINSFLQETFLSCTQERLLIINYLRGSFPRFLVISSSLGPLKALR